MTISSFGRLAGLLAMVAGPAALGSLLLGLSAVGYDFERFSDPQTILTLGAGGAATLRWSYLLSMLGAYLLLIPAALCLDSIHAADHRSARRYTFAGLIYLLLGALGAATLAAVWPLLITRYGSAGADQQASIEIAFETATTIAEDGFQGIVQNIAGAVWFGGMGTLLWRQRRLLGGFSVAIGVCLALNTIGNLLLIEPLSLIGLTATILLVPLWSIGIGVILVRQSAAQVQTIAID